MKTTLLILILACIAGPGFSQEIRRISKSAEAIGQKNQEYANAIASSKNPAQATAVYQNKDSLLFLKDLAAFFEGFEASLKNEDMGGTIFKGANRRMDYIVFVSNTGYSDAFYYDFESGKYSMAFVSALNTFIANYKWENSKKAKFTHRGSYVFK